MRSNFIILFVIIFAAIGSAYYFQNISPQQGVKYAPIDTDVPKHKRQKVPEFAGQRSSDNEHFYVPKDTKGKVLLINFWASWCAPCVAEFPALISVASEFEDEAILLGISSDMSINAMQGFFDKINYAPKNNEWMILDNGGAITSGLFQTYMLPETLLVDQKGYIVKKYIGLEWTEEDMISDINKLLK